MSLFTKPGCLPLSMPQSSVGKLRAIVPPRSDAALLELLKQGGPGAAAELVRAHGARVHRAIWSIMGADDEHDDVVHTALIRVMRGAHRVRDPSTLESWVVSVAVNTARNELRRRKIRRIVRTTNRPPEMVHPPVDHEGRSLLRRVYAILDRLPVEDRTVFTLRYVEGLPLAEIGPLVGRSLATIKRRLQAAQRRFAELAADDPDLVERFQRGGRFPR